MIILLIFSIWNCGGKDLEFSHTGVDRSERVGLAVLDVAQEPKVLQKKKKEKEKEKEEKRKRKKRRINVFAEFCFAAVVSAAAGARPSILALA